VKVLAWGGLFLLLMGPGCRPDPLKREVASLLRAYPRDVAFFSRSSLGVEPELRFQLEAGNIQSAWMVFTRLSLPGGWAPLEGTRADWVHGLDAQWQRLGGGRGRGVDWAVWKGDGGDAVGWVLAVSRRLLTAYARSELSGREAAALWMMLGDTMRTWLRDPVQTDARALALCWLGRLSSLPDADLAARIGRERAVNGGQPPAQGDSGGWMTWGRLSLPPCGTARQ